MLIGARLLQGVGGAVASSVILAIIVTEFPEAAEQAKAMGLYAFVSAGGGSIGLLAGGALTQSLDWHWIFFVNVPIGVVAFVLGSALIEENEGIGLAGGVDVLGSVLITLATMLGAFAIVKSSEYGLLSARTLGVGGASLALLGGFLALESRIANPIMPLRILRLRMLMGSSLVRGLLVTGMFSAFFLGALYLERVLGYDAIDTGLAFMPLTIAIAVDVDGRLGAAGRALRRGATRSPAGLVGIVVGPAAAGDGRACTRATSPACSSRSWLLGLGAGASFLPLLTIGMSDAPAQRRGARLGDHQRLGAAVRRDRPGDARHDRDRPHQGADARAGTRCASALTGGYHLAYVVAAVCVALGIVAALPASLRPPARTVAQMTEEAEHEHEPRVPHRSSCRPDRPRCRPDRAALRLHAQLGPPDLAARGLRQLRREVDDARVLVGRGLALDVLLQLARELGRGGVAVAQHDDRAHDRAALLVGRGDGGGLGHGRVGDERGLDLERPDPVAGRDDHVVVAALEAQPAVVVFARRGRRCARARPARAVGDPRRATSRPRALDALAEIAEEERRHARRVGDQLAVLDRQRRRPAAPRPIEPGRAGSPSGAPSAGRSRSGRSRRGSPGPWPRARRAAPPG